jgi:hypothetical protein
MLLFSDVISLYVFLFVVYYLCNFSTFLCRLCYWPNNARFQNSFKNINVLGITKTFKNYTFR